MTKVKLATELINNALNFYNQNLGEVFSEEETKNLSKKLLNIIEYDYIIKGKLLPYDLPQYTLTTIYFIGEYKKAYLYTKDNYKKNRKNTLESLDKGFIKKKEEYKKLLSIINDKTIDKQDRVEANFKRTLLFAIKNKKYSKTGMLIVGMFYNNFPLFIRHLKFRYSNSKKILGLLKLIEEAMQYFEYTYLSSDKIINSLLIVLYSKLTSIGIAEKQAFKFSKELVTMFIDENYLPTDKYRLSYLKEKDIYFAGLYNGMPIFQWYTGKENSYYSKNDIQQFQKFAKMMKEEIEKSFTTSFITNSIFKSLVSKQEINLTTILDMLINNKDTTKKEMLSLHKTFVIMPIRLTDILSPLKITYFDRLKAMFLAFFTIFADLKTKLAK